MFAEDIVPVQYVLNVVFISKSLCGRMANHSVSALGSSTGTLTGISGICMAAVEVIRYIEAVYRIE